MRPNSLLVLSAGALHGPMTFAEAAARFSPKPPAVVVYAPLLAEGDAEETGRVLEEGGVARVIGRADAAHRDIRTVVMPLSFSLDATLLFSIGLTDGAGEEVFDGDEVQAYPGEVWTVGWHENGAGYAFFDQSGTHRGPVHADRLSRMTRLGNAHDPSRG